MSTYQHILTEISGRVGLITLNRPESYNSLNIALLEELIDSLEHFDDLDNIGAMVITGNQKSFAAGADITHMLTATEDEIRNSPFIPTFTKINNIKKPLIAAVAGFCLGGGFEVAMACDLITAAENSKFGQPEINLGIIPGAGGTQRLTRAVGKVIAMEMILTNRTLSAQEALHFGLINHVYPTEEYLSLTIDLAQKVAGQAPLAILAAKKSIKQSFESHLEDGLDLERDIFYKLFSSQDQKEGMQAFFEKRDAKWSGK